MIGSFRGVNTRKKSRSSRAGARAAREIAPQSDLWAAVSARAAHWADIHPVQKVALEPDAGCDSTASVSLTASWINTFSQISLRLAGLNWIDTRDGWGNPIARTSISVV